MDNTIKRIELVDSGCDKYKIVSDCCCLGRQWDNFAEKIQVVIPKEEVGNVCTMVVSADGEVIDHINVTAEPIDITNVLSRHQFVEISFCFTNETEYLKNTEIKQFYFAKSRKPEDFVPVEPEQTGKIDVLLAKGFVKAEVDGDIIKFYNAGNQVVSEVEIKGIGGGITEELDPTVPEYVKAISETDIENWNNKVDSGVLAKYYLKKETYSREEVNELVSKINSFNKTIVETLPTENIDENTIYLVAKETGTGSDYYDEYLYINGSFEHIGSTQVDLEGFATTEQFENVNNKIDSIYNEDTHTLTAQNLSDGTTTKAISEVLAGGSGGGVSQEDFEAVKNKTDKMYVDGWGGFGIGTGATSGTGGGAVGYQASSSGGGAVGHQAFAGRGFAGGYKAKAWNTTSIQLGEGENNTNKSLQIFDKNIYNAETDTLKVANITDGITTKSVTDILAGGGSSSGGGSGESGGGGSTPATESAIEINLPLFDSSVSLDNDGTIKGNWSWGLGYYKDLSDTTRANNKALYAVLDKIFASNIEDNHIYGLDGYNNIGVKVGSGTFQRNRYAGGSGFLLSFFFESFNGNVIKIKIHSYYSDMSGNVDMVRVAATDSYVDSAFTLKLLRK